MANFCEAWGAAVHPLAATAQSLTQKDGHPMSDLTDRSAEEERQLNEAIALSLQQSQPAAPMNTTEDDDEERMMQEALALSMQQPSTTTDPSPPGDEPAVDPAAEYADADAGGPSLARLIFGDGSSPEVLRQWKSQGFLLADVDLSESPGITPFSAGLAQEHGGPCAVLAAAQAFMLRRLLYDPTPAAPSAAPAWLGEAPDGDGSLLPSDEEANEGLMRGLADILCSCATAPDDAASAAPATDALSACAVVIAVPTDELLASAALEASPEQLLRAFVASASRPRGWSATLATLRSRRAGLASPLGALSILVSAVLTRGVVRFCRERDDASQPVLDSQFGHCSQELLNLLLLGVGVSNVFDGVRCAAHSPALARSRTLARAHRPRSALS